MANAAHSFAGLELSRRAQRSPSASLLQVSTRRLRKKLVLALKGRGFQPRRTEKGKQSTARPEAVPFQSELNFTGFSAAWNAKSCEQLWSAILQQYFS